MSVRPLGTVLVTGAGGFLGAAAVRALRADGVAVIAADLAGAAPGAGAAPWDVPCDVTDFDAVAAAFGAGPVDTVLHCAAVSGPMVMADRPADIWTINAQGTMHVLEAARRAGVGRVVVCSTSEVYGERGGVVDETVATDPRSVYAASKVAAEAATLGYVREHGLDAVALRLSWIYGPGRTTPTDLARVLRAGLSGEVVRVSGHPDETTHYLYIDDAVAGLRAAATVARPGVRVVNVAAGEGRSLRAVLDDLRELLPGVRAEVSGDAAAPERPAGFDISRAAALGFAPRVSFKEGAARYLAALRAAPEG